MPVEDDQFKLPVVEVAATRERAQRGRVARKSVHRSRLLKGILSAGAAAALLISMPMSVLAAEPDATENELVSDVDTTENELVSDVDTTDNELVSDVDTTADESLAPEGAAVQAPAARAAAVVSAVCEPGVFYSIQSNGNIKQIRVSGSNATSTNWSTWTTREEANALGIGKNGSPMYALERQSNNGDVIRIRRYSDDPASPTLLTDWYNADLTASIVAGAVHPITGDYYFGGYTKEGSRGNQHYDFKLFRFNGTSITVVGVVHTGTNTSANGDIAFDAAGNLYILHASGTAARFLTVSAATLDNPPAQGHLPTGSTATKTLTISDANGMAFDNDGTVIVGNGTTAYRYDPATWEPIGSRLTNSLGTSTDLASCTTAPPTLELVKNVAARANASDQFKVAIADESTPSSPFVSGTTEGSDTGVQDSATEKAGPAIVRAGNKYVLSETMATGSRSNLGAYGASLTCTATYSGGTPQPIYQGTTLTKNNTSATATIQIPATDPVKGNPAIKCVITNNPGEAKLKVDKYWVIDGAAPVAHAQRPDGLNATPTIKLNNAGIANAAWGTEVKSTFGASYEVSETVTLGGDYELCTVKRQITKVNGTETTIDASQPYTGTLDRELTSIEYTNTVSCSTLTLVKNVKDTDGITELAPTSWTLTASAQNQQSVTGAGYASARVKAGVAYALSEAGNNPTYVQDGNWTCQLVTSVDADGKPNGFGDPVTVTGGNQVTVPEGKHVQCAVTNATAALTVLKEVPDDSGASFSEDDFTFDVTPSANQLGLTPVTGIAGATERSAANTVSVRPGHAYSVTEASNNPKLAYVNTKVEKQNADGSWTAVDPSSITLAAGEHLTIRFVNVPPSSAALPLTGAFDNLFTVIGGGGALAALAVAAWYVMRRKPAAGAGSLLDD